MKFSKFLKRLIMFSLLIATLPIVLLGIFSYLKSSYIIQEKVNQGNVQILLQSQMGMEQVLKTLDDAVRRFVCLPIVQDSMLAKREPDNYQIFSELYRNLFLLQNSNLNILDINLVNLDKGWYMCFRGVYDLAFYTDKTELDKYIDFNETSFWVCQENENQSIVSFVKKIPVNSLRPDGLIIVKIQYSELNKLLSQSYGLGKGMVLDKESGILAREDNSMLEMVSKHSGFNSELAKVDTEVGYFELKDGKEIYGITSSKSSYNGWTYLNVVSINEMTKDANSIKWFTMLICALIILLSTVISLMGSRKIYSPIRKLYNIVQRIEGKNEAIFDERDEFKSIGDKINILMNAQAQMKNAIEVQHEQLKEFFVLKLLQGKVKIQDMDSQLKAFNYPPAMKWLCILTIHIDGFDDMPARDQDLMAFAVNNIVSEIIQHQYQIGITNIEQYHVVFLGGVDEHISDMKNFIYELARIIQKIIGDCYSLKASIGISRLFSEFKKTHQVFKKTVDALKYKIPLGTDAIIYEEDLKPGFPMHYSYLTDIQRETIEAIKLADREKVRELLNRFVVQVFQKGLSSNQYRYVFLRLMTHFVSLAEVLGEKNFYNDEALQFDRMFDLKSSTEIEKWLFDTMIEPLIIMFEESRGSQYRKISKDVINIIRKEFDTELTLEKCAARLNYHPGYISRVFSSEVGITFSEYLSKYRMEIAKNWLAQSHMKVQEISERIKYNNSQNFIRQFRKQEGLTPGEFRKRNAVSGKPRPAFALNEKA